MNTHQRRIVLLTATLIVLATFSALADRKAVAEEAKGGGDALPNCPIMGEPINLAVSTPTHDGPVFFCCKGCIDKYEENPEKYAKGVKAQRKYLEAQTKVQVTCPVSMEPVKEDVFVEVDGTKVGFCCEGCAGKYKKNPGKYAAALTNSYTYQTKCPVMDEDIDPSVYTTLANGSKIYFCCNKCSKKLKAKPNDYLAKLAKQGYTFRKKDVVSEESKHDGHGHGEHDGHGHGEHDAHEGHDHDH